MSHPIVALKGTVAAISALPATGNTIGDTYVVTAENSVYVWTGTSWMNKAPLVTTVANLGSGYVLITVADVL